MELPSKRHPLEQRHCCLLERMPLPKMDLSGFGQQHVVVDSEGTSPMLSLMTPP